MMVILFLISGAVSILLILSGIIVLLVPSKKKKQPVPQTLSQALGIDKVEVRPTPVHTQVFPVQDSEFATKFFADAGTTPAAPSHSAVSAEQIKQLVVNNEILLALADGIQKINNARKNEQIIKTAKSLLQTAENVDDTQNRLVVKQYVETIYPDFFEKLNNAVSADIDTTATTENLTDFEIRVCLLQIFDFSSKEIAQITNRSVRTIETIIYRIRKKLSIPTEERLSDFLKNL
ncbi:MAG: sigma-70 region 4 domain-containing protein [Bacteroidales bacterium]|jgi:DNA-binding CsgD family transcriptional regulator|nr:sigma-70 region 4 domain-containing protein [Bacteroidales bacterium]